MISFVRTVIIYILVIVVMRCMGKRQIGQLQPYEFVIALMISDVATVPMQDTAVPLRNGVIPILSLMLLQLLLSYLVLKVKPARSFICGRPCVLIRRGTVLESALRKQMYTLDDLLEALRIKGYPRVDEILMAVLENNGDLSVLPYSYADTVRRADLQITAAESFTTDLIVSGRLMEDNMALCGVDRKMLREEIRKCGASSFKDVFYCYIDASGAFYTQLRSGAQQKSAARR